MKKLITLPLSILLLIVKANAQTPDDSKSLNGVTYGSVKAMTSAYQNYIKDNPLSPKQQSIWFKAETFRQMIAAAKKKQPAIDGIRIYFGINGDPKKNFVFKIILVPTIDDGECPACPSGRLHKDFYLDSVDSLFTNYNVQERQMIRRAVLTRGERLYVWSHIPSDDDVQCPQNGRHYITREQALQWIGNVGKPNMVTHSEWFDINLINAIANDTKHDGIRIYIAKHNLVETDTTLNNKDMFIIETTRHHFLSHRDYFDCQITADYFKTHKPNVVGGGTNPGGQDDGELCPDNCKP